LLGGIANAGAATAIAAFACGASSKDAETASDG